MRRSTHTLRRPFRPGGAPPRRGAAGFALTELLVVTIILGILAAVAISLYLSQREKAERVNAVSTLRNVQTFAETIRADEDAYSTDPATYERDGGTDAYTYLDNGVSTGPKSVSLVATSAPAEGGAVFAARTDERCFYLRLVPDGGPTRHHATVGGSVECRADEFATGAGAGW